VLNRGPWRHKGDALLVVHYDGMVRPSEIKIEVIGVWVRFYDLPPAMMKENHARQLGERVGRFIKMDARFPGYLRVRVDFPLSKPLVQTLQVKIKGRGPMLNTLRYENVPHFYFSCGRLGHTAFNCNEGDAEDGSVKFGEELRASPPRRVREITIRSTTPGVVKNLFSTGSTVPRNYSTRIRPSSSGLSCKEQGVQSCTKEEGQGTEAGKLKEIISNELVHSVKDMQMDYSSPNRSWSAQSGGAKERVSFGTDRSSSEESDNSANMHQYMQDMQTAVGRFHAKKFRTKSYVGAERKAALKVQAGGATRKTTHR
jgi:hypothetical protein